MKNWAENVSWNPSDVYSPATEEEIVKIVRDAIAENRNVRIAGSCHSFTSLVQSDDVYLDLNNFQGIVEVDPVEKTATVKAGTKLKLLGDLLFKHDLAQENLGDIDAQSIAGSISTGTHGTGIEFGNISTQICEIRFVNGKGELVECSENNNPDLFKAMQISLGSLGIITLLKLKLIPFYKLELIKDKGDINATLANLDNLNENNRNFEFYWMPYTDAVQTKTTNISNDLVDKRGFAAYIDEVVLENYMFKVLCEIAKKIPSTNNSIAALTAKFISHNRKVHFSHQVYATVRMVKFYEMEYNVHYEAYQDVMKDVIKCVSNNDFKIHFPIENRFVKGDDIFLSPAYKRKSAYIACHVYKGKDYKKYFNALEEIYIAYDGRPHWGKMHTRNTAYFAKTYPMWEQFHKMRMEHDPNGTFMNSYLRELFL